jgi:Family of unknown function (DUF6069)
MATSDYVDLEEPTIPNAGRLWAGGVATAMVAALVVIVGVMIARGILHVAVLAPKRASSYGNSTTSVYAVTAALAVLLAVALLHLLLLIAPRPLNFFLWIAGLANLAAVAAPFARTAPLTSQAATAVINLAVGVSAMSLLSGVARAAVRAGHPRRN